MADEGRLARCRAAVRRASGHLRGGAGRWPGASRKDGGVSPVGSARQSCTFSLFGHACGVVLKVVPPPVWNSAYGAVGAPAFWKTRGAQMPRRRGRAHGSGRAARLAAEEGLRGGRPHQDRATRRGGRARRAPAARSRADAPAAATKGANARQTEGFGAFHTRRIPARQCPQKWKFPPGAAAP